MKTNELIHPKEVRWRNIPVTLTVPFSERTWSSVRCSIRGSLSQTLANSFIYRAAKIRCRLPRERCPIPPPQPRHYLQRGSGAAFLPRHSERNRLLSTVVHPRRIMSPRSRSISEWVRAAVHAANYEHDYRWSTLPVLRSRKRASPNARLGRWLCL